MRRVTAFAIIRDADASSENTFRSVAKTLENVGLPFPKRSGEFKNKSNKKVGVFIMPDSTSHGMLEHLCLRTVADHPVLKHVDTMFTSFSKELVRRDPPEAPLVDGVLYYPKNEAKAKVQAFLSGMHETVNNIGHAAREKYWDFDHAALADLKAFISNLRIPV